MARFKPEPRSYVRQNVDRFERNPQSPNRLHPRTQLARGIIHVLASVATGKNPTNKTHPMAASRKMERRIIRALERNHERSGGPVDIKP